MVKIKFSFYSLSGTVPSAPLLVAVKMVSWLSSIPSCPFLPISLRPLGSASSALLSLLCCPMVVPSLLVVPLASFTMVWTCAVSFPAFPGPVAVASMAVSHHPLQSIHVANRCVAEAMHCAVLLWMACPSIFWSTSFLTMVVVIRVGSLAVMFHVLLVVLLVHR